MEARGSEAFPLPRGRFRGTARGDPPLAVLAPAERQAVIAAIADILKPPQGVNEVPLFGYCAVLETAWRFSISNIWFGVSTARAAHGYGPAPALGRKPCSSASTQCGNSKNRSARPPPSVVALPDGDLRRARPRVIAGAPRQFCAATCGARAAVSRRRGAAAASAG
jgi:hypothetical protein